MAEELTPIDKALVAAARLNIQEIEERIAPLMDEIRRQRARRPLRERLWVTFKQWRRDRVWR